MVYYNPKSIDEAIKLLDSLEKDNLVILAGGTDVVPKINSRPERSGYFDKPLMDLDNCQVVYLGDAGLGYIKDERDKIIVGSMVTMTELLESDIIGRIPVLKEAIANMAGLTIRNTATIGGNVMNASPAADSVPPLIALGAEAVLASMAGERTVAVEALFDSPGKTTRNENELLKELIIPIRPGSASFLKFGRRKAESLSIVNGAAYVEMNGEVCKKAVIALGAVAPTPLRATEAENAIIGKKMTDENIEAAADAAAGMTSPINDKRASGEYRKKLVKTLVKRTLGKACQ